VLIYLILNKKILKQANKYTKKNIECLLNKIKESSKVSKDKNLVSI
jgi:uncharacterized protein YmfQ (DUF2313 family)